MLENARGLAFTPHRRRFGMRDFSRVATWGLAALGALTLAAYAASSETGEERLILAVASIRGVPPPERLARAPDDGPARQFAATVRELSADRERLLARLDNLERNVGDVTSSIARTVNPPAATAPVPATLPPIVSVPQVVATATTFAFPDNPAFRATPTPQTEEPAATLKPEFGVDLGRANSVEGLRQLWNTVKSRHGGALEGLRPVVAVREVARGGGVELRLVAGPLANAAASARVCAMLPGSACHPTVFEGQKLALR